MTKIYTVEVWDNGDTFWKNDKGEWHRENGPAIELSNGTKSWYLNGKLHRIGGPAIEWSSGSKEWFLNGERFPSEAEWKKAVDALKQSSCTGKIVEIDGKKYKLTEV